MTTNRHLRPRPWSGRLFAEPGYRGVSMNAVARAAAMSHTGLVHHFPIKDDLLLAVLDRRDEVDAAQTTERDGGRLRGWSFIESLVDRVRHNERQPQIVRLYTSVAGDAVAPGHPANHWPRGHHERTFDLFRTALAEAAEDGELGAAAPVDTITRILVATLDGLQIQWLSDEDYPTMSRDFEALVAVLRAQWGGPGAQRG